MKTLSLLVICLICLIGCGGSGSKNSTKPKLAGNYEGTWVNVADPLDHGASVWTVQENGNISGSDVDVSNEFSYVVLGTTDASGNVSATTSLVGGEEVINLTGQLKFDSAGRLTGDLVWASTPPLTYRYTFTRTTR